MSKKGELYSGKIGLWAASVVGINAMIGAGVLTIPTMLSNIVGPAGIISSILSVFFVLCIGLSLGRAADIYPGAGWNYLYPSKWAGHRVGFLSSFCYLFAIIVAMGFLVQQAGIYCAQFIPISPKPLSAIILLVLTLLVLMGAQAASWSQYLIVIFVIVPLLLTAIFCWSSFDANLIKPFVPYGVSSIFKGMSTILFAFLGFESIASLYPIVEDPQKNIPKAFLISILTVGILYVLFIYGILFAVPSLYFNLGISEPLSSVLASFFPSYKFLSVLVLVGAVFGILGTIHSMLWSVSELFTGVLQRSKSKFVANCFKKNFWNEKIAIIVTALLIFISFLILHARILIPMTVFLIVPSYVLSIASLLFVKKEWSSYRNIITVFGLIGGLLFFYFAGHMTFAALF